MVLWAAKVARNGKVGGKNGKDRGKGGKPYLLPPQPLGGKGSCGEASYRLGKGLPDWEGITMWLLRCHPRQEREKRMFLM